MSAINELGFFISTFRSEAFSASGVDGAILDPNLGQLLVGHGVDVLPLQVEQDVRADGVALSDRDVAVLDAGVCFLDDNLL